MLGRLETLPCRSHPILWMDWKFGEKVASTGAFTGGLHHDHVLGLLRQVLVGQLGNGGLDGLPIHQQVGSTRGRVWLAPR